MDTTVPENPDSQRTELRSSWTCLREVSQGQHHFAVLQMLPTGSTGLQREGQGKAAQIKGYRDSLWDDGKEANTTQLHPPGTREAFPH